MPVVTEVPLLSRENLTTMSKDVCDQMHTVTDDQYDESDDGASSIADEEVDTPHAAIPAGNSVHWPFELHEHVHKDRLWEHLPTEGLRKRLLIDGSPSTFKHSRLALHRQIV